ncbi:hypothetical protein, partial [Mangrovimonas aestuarii]|uniref:hypothetical protein n=1 Tax=Mangrovimonas aestuarii TaxID=3018443 RepID=UPI0023792674
MTFDISKVLTVKNIALNIFAACSLLIPKKSEAQTYPPNQNLSSINFQGYQGPNGSFPGYLEPFTESLSGNTITRISDSGVFGTTGQNLKHNYSTDQPWNSDGSLIKLAGYPAAILDGDTYQFIKWAQIPGNGKWANTNPNLIYGVSGNQFIAYNVNTNNNTTLHTFSNYSSVSFGYGEGNQSNDDKYVVLIGQASGVRDLIVYNIQNNTIVSTHNVGTSGDLDWATISPLGTYVVVSWRDNGSGSTQGLKIYNRDFSNYRHLYDYTEHSDVAIDANGNEVIVQYGNQPEWNSNNYLAMIRLDNGNVQGLFNYSYGIWGGHVSTRNLSRPGWAYVSVECCPNGSAAPNEIFAIKLDASNTIERYAKHHSNDGQGYGHQAQAVPNRDGTRVIFASNWNSAVGGSYAPAWVVEVPQSGNNNPTVEVNAGNDQTICEGDNVTLTATGADSYEWSNGETGASITVSPSETTTYTVT